MALPSRYRPVSLGWPWRHGERPENTAVHFVVSPEARQCTAGLPARGLSAYPAVLSAMRDESAPPLFAYRTEVALRSHHRSTRHWAAWLLVLLAVLSTALLGYGVFLWLLSSNPRLQ